MSTPEKPGRAPFTPTDLLKIAAVACARAGYDIHDMEYQSAINYGVALCWQRYGNKPDNIALLSTIAIKCALSKCSSTRKRLEKLRLGDQAGARRGWYESPAYVLPIDLDDFELLLFVASNGKKRAARLLGMDYYKLLRLLEDVQLRLDR